MTTPAQNAIIQHREKESEMKIVVKMPQKTRAHLVLFCANTPFKQKRVESKIKYKRNPKHKGARNAD